MYSTYIRMANTKNSANLGFGWPRRQQSCGDWSKDRASARNYDVFEGNRTTRTSICSKQQGCKGQQWYEDEWIYSTLDRACTPSASDWISAGSNRQAMRITSYGSKTKLVSDGEIRLNDGAWYCIRNHQWAKKWHRTPRE